MSNEMMPRPDYLWYLDVRLPFADELLDPDKVIGFVTVGDRWIRGVKTWYLEVRKPIGGTVLMNRANRFSTFSQGSGGNDKWRT